MALVSEKLFDVERVLIMINSGRKVGLRRSVLDLSEKLIVEGEKSCKVRIRIHALFLKGRGLAVVAR